MKSSIAPLKVANIYSGMHPIILLIVALWNEIKKTVAALWSELKHVQITISYKSEKKDSDMQTEAAPSIDSPPDN